MAIIKPKILTSGVSVTYWRIKLIQVSPFLGTATIYWEGYLDESARATGATSAIETSEVISLSKELFGSLYALVSPLSLFRDGEPIIVDSWKTQPNVETPATEFPDPLPVNGPPLESGPLPKEGVAS